MSTIQPSGTHPPSPFFSTASLDDHSSREQVEKIAIDPTISSLIKNLQNNLSVNDLIDLNPEILLTIQGYTLAQLESLVKQCLHGENSLSYDQILKSVQLLYLISLKNSSYHDTAKKLDGHLLTYVKILIASEDYESMIEETLKKPLTNELPVIRKEMGECQNLIQKINQVIALFWYIEENNKEKISLLASHSKDSKGDPTLPICHRFFNCLCTALHTLEKPKEKWIPLRKKLLEQIEKLQIQVNNLQPSKENIPLSGERKKLYLHHETLFWELGEQLLENAFNATFAQKKQFNGFLPKQLVIAIQKAATGQYAHLHFKHLTTKKIPKLPPSFVHQIWIAFLGEDAPISDIEDLMQLIVNEISENQWDRFQSQIKNGSLDSLDTITLFINPKGGSFLSLELLKNWVTRALQKKSIFQYT